MLSQSKIKPIQGRSQQIEKEADHFCQNVVYD